MNDFFLSLLKRLRLLPILVVVASLAFMVRIGDTFFQIKNMSGSAYAQEEKKAEEAPKVVKADEAATPPKDELKEPAADSAIKLPNEPDVEKGGAKTETVLDSSTKKKWDDAESDVDDSDVRKEVYDDLMQRRQQIEKKEMELSQREALLKAGTEEINKKVEELTAIKTEIQSLLKKQNTEEEANTSRLVKIYEGMKPKEAARIFNQLDMDVLLSVVTKMSERKASSVIAVMDPDKARSLTLFLSEQNKLPGSGSSPAGFGNPNKPPPIPESAVQ